MKWFVTGDTHADVSRFRNLNLGNPSEIGMIILGDAGCNYFLADRDKQIKKKMAKIGYNWYLIRGNHEERPENLGFKVDYDEEVCGNVFVDPDYPTIKYLIDGMVYDFNGYRTLVIGGAYSVDKYYRLERGWSWFKDEQLTESERELISNLYIGEDFDFIMSHTCPVSWEPRDLFLSAVDQSTVDKSMELWLEEFKDTVNWSCWLFGHYHADRLVRPGVEMMFHAIEELDNIWKRVEANYSAESIRYIPKDPNYFL